MMTARRFFQVPAFLCLECFAPSRGRRETLDLDPVGTLHRLGEVVDHLESLPGLGAAAGTILVEGVAELAADFAFG